MGIRPSGSKNITILEIDCEEFKLIISGNPEDGKATRLGYASNTMAEFLTTGDYCDRVSIKTCGSDGTLVDSFDGVMLPSFFENGLYQVVLQSKDKADYVLLHMDSDLDGSVQTLGDFKFGNISFDSDIGYSAFSIIRDGKKILNFTLEVFPSKLNYQSDYKEIVNDINNEISALAFEILGKTFLNTQLKDTKNQTNWEYINILKIIFDDMEKDIKRICNHFKHNIETIEQVKSIEKSKVIARRTADYIRKHPGTLIEGKGGFIELRDDRHLTEAVRTYYPSKVIDRRKITTIDIFENRYVKYMITTIIRRLSIIEKNLDSAYKEKSPYLDFVKEKKSTLQRYLKIYFKNISDLTDKKSMTLVFQMSPGYKELYKKYMLLKKGLALGEDLFEMTPKKLYKLYEIWCYIKMHQLLRNLGYAVKEHGILKYRDNGLTLTLSQDNQAKTSYEKGDRVIELWYNKSYSSLPTTQQRPDIVLSIKDSGNERVYIFDAKYRINVNDAGVISPMEDDINVMHKYRDSIVSKLNNGYQFKYETFGAYVMFPCPNESEFVNNQYYRSIEEVNIGALPMLPGSTHLMEQHLEKIIGESLVEAKDRRVLQDELDDFVKFKEKNVMIVNTYDREHFEKYKEHRFYHIPKSKLAKVRLGVEYLAFYESKNSVGEEAGIRYYARIKDVVEYKRGDCKELPISSRGKEDEIYLRFILEEFTHINKIEVKQIPTRIETYTTLYLLNNASNTQELYIKSSLEIKVYKKLLEAEKKTGLRVKKEKEQYHLGKSIINIDHTNSRVYINGMLVAVDEIEEEIVKEHISN